MSTNQLSGSLPSSYGSWTSLVNFSANSNKLCGSIPESFARWTNLQRIFLSNNAVEGSLPLFIAESWRNILTIGFGNNNFPGTIPASYASLNATLVELLQCNQLSGSLPDSFGTMRALRSLPPMWGWFFKLPEALWPWPAEYLCERDNSVIVVFNRSGGAGR
uniref:Receptor-type protein kinase n=1 Tax=Bodo saltans TaxID=75058 RepID=B6DTP4_BODSA|nr:receptor-type protein kinase [Bodo saltans]